MKLGEAIVALRTMLQKHGDVTLYFDCPHCAQSFTPGHVAAKAVHVAAQDEVSGKAKG